MAPSPARTNMTRAAIVVSAAIVVLLAYWFAEWKRTVLGISVSGAQAAWLMASAQIVSAVYKFGVGSLSRYAPPAESHMKDAPLTTPRT